METHLVDLEIGDRFNHFDTSTDVWVVVSKAWVEDRHEYDFIFTMVDDEESQELSLPGDSTRQVRLLTSKE